MNAYKQAYNKAHIKKELARVSQLLKQGRKDEARLVLEYIKVWNQIASLSKPKRVL